jgi:hypothetical protein
MPEEVRKAKPRRRLIQPGSFADSALGKVVLVLVGVLGLLFLTTFLFLASGEGAAFWWYAWVAIASFLVPSSHGNGAFVLLSLFILIDMFFAVKVVIGTEVYRCRSAGKDNGRVWKGRTWTGWDLLIHSKMTFESRKLPGSTESVVHGRNSYGTTGFNEITFVHHVLPVRDSKHRRIVFYKVPTRVHPPFPTYEQYKEIVRQTTSRKRSIYNAQGNVGRPFSEAVTESKQVVGG